MKNNLKKYLLIFLTLMLVVMLVVACNPTDDPDKVIETEDPEVTLTINNGNFATTTDTSSPAAPSKWTTTGNSTVTRGTINISDAAYSAYLSKNSSHVDGNTYWYSADNPGKPTSTETKNLDADNYVLMLYGATAMYGGYYGSSTISIAAATDYVLTFYAKTSGLNGKAQVKLTGSTSVYHEVVISEANMDWTKYEVYIQGHPTTAKTFSLYVTLGTSNTTAGYASGAVYFDSFYLSTIGAEDTMYEKVSYDTATPTATLSKTTTVLGNPEFDYASTSGTPSLYTVVSSNSNTYRVVDTTEAAWEANKASYGYTSSNELDGTPGVPDGAVGSNVFMIYNGKKSYTGVKANVALTAERSKTYAISIYVKTLFHDDGEAWDGEHGYATLKLVDGNENEYVITTTKAVSTEWTKYTFYILGNETAATNLTLHLNFGTEANECRGWAFFDKLAITEVDTLPSIPMDTQTGNDAIYDLRTIASSVLTNNMFNGGVAGFTTAYDDGSSNLISGVDASGVTAGVIDTATDYTTVAPVGGGANVSIPTLGEIIMPYGYPDNTGSSKNVFVINANKPSIYSVNFKDAGFNLNTYSYYKLSVWVKTVGIQSTAGLYATLYNADDDKSLATISLVNTESIKTGLLNGWLELTFYVQTGIETEEVYLNVALGSGGKYTSSTLAEGTAYLANLMLTKVSYSDYSAASGTYKKTASFITSDSPSFSNGEFNNYNMSEVEGLNDDGMIDDGEGGQKLSEKFGTPNGWTLTNGIDDKLSNQVAGIVDLKRGNNLVANIVDKINANAVLTAADLTNTLFTNPTPGSLVDYQYASDANQRVLLLASSNVSTDSDYASLNFTTSSSTSLTASSYYAFTVIAKTIRNAEASIYMFDSDNKVLASFELFNTTSYYAANADETNYNGWVKYTFYVQTGISTESIKFGLYLGDKNTVGEIDSDNKIAVGGAVMFDKFTQYTIDKAAFIAATETNLTTEANQLKKVSFTNDSFESFTSSSTSGTLDTPSGWTGDDLTDGATSGTLAGIVTASNQSAFLDKLLHLDEASFDEADASSKAPFYKKVVNGTETTWAVWNEGDGDSNKYTNTSLTDTLANLYARKAALAATIVGHDSDSLLLIYNNELSAYDFTSGAMSLAANKYYKISFFAKVSELTEGKAAYGQVYVSASEKYEFKVTSTEWQQFTFYFKVTTAKSVNVIFGLGSIDAVDGSKVENYSKGFAMFDDVAVETITASAYTAATESSTVKKAEFITTTTPAEEGSDDTDDDTNKGKNNYRWLIFSSVAIGAIMIIVVIIYFIKKWKPVRKPRVPKADYDVTKNATPESLKKKDDKYKDLND